MAYSFRVVREEPKHLISNFQFKASSKVGSMKFHWLNLYVIFVGIVRFSGARSIGDQPLANVAIHKATYAIHESAFVKAWPSVMGVKGGNSELVTVIFGWPTPSDDDWIGVFSPGNFNASTCEPENTKDQSPYLCTAPIKYQFANYSSPDYRSTGRGVLKLQLINQRSDFAFALFSGGLSNPKLVAVSNRITFANPRAPLYPRLAQGKSWNEMTVTWTSGYSIDEAEPLVEWGREGGDHICSPAGTLTFTRNSMCGAPARTVGWRDPGFVHTSFLKDLWPNAVYTYKLGHKLSNGSYDWSRTYHFKASPFPGQDSLQRVIIFGDMGKGERDGSNEFNNYQPGSLNTTDQLIRDVKNYDIVFHIGDLSYANGYISQWDQFTAQVEPIASVVPYMTARYSTDYGMFRFCVANTEHDWREGTEQYKFIEECFATVDRRKQPWLIFLAHRVLGYSSDNWYALDGSFAEPMGRESLQGLWQKYKVDLALYGHVHSYERTCPIYQNICTNNEKYNYVGPLNGTIHVVAGGGGAGLGDFTTLQTRWSIYKDRDFGFVKLTAFDHSRLLLEYKKSRDGKVYDSFTLSRDYRDILVCTVDSCARQTLAS
ncbi:probable inactive purple acid phosphatase 1 isoform X3 [Aristolochia californica]|uniref:probable inactive purple acid phosphatase 1 isoform X3 n=1 Tax=Aristolochia californica TaxID=171875 RepID=UPI0035E35C82